MMEHFEANGLWYSPDDPSNAVGGTLKFDDDGLHLTLIGSFREGWGPGVERYPLITGIVDKCPYGSIVSLIDGYSLGSSFNMVGVTSERIRCMRAAIGNFHLSEEPFDYESLELGYTHLTEWVGRGSLDFKHVQGEPIHTATFRRPEDVTEDFNDRSIMLGTNFTAQRSAHRVVLAVEHRLLVEPLGEVASNELGEDHVRTFQNLMSFATDRPNAVDRIIYSCAKNEHQARPLVNLIYEQMYKPKEHDKKITFLDMLFVLDDLKDTSIKIFKGWSEFSKNYREFVTVYFAYIYQPPRFVEDRFSRVLKAFMLLCTSLGRGSKRTKPCLIELNSLLDSHFSSGERVLIDHAMPDEAELGMAFVLRDLLDEHSSIMDKIIPDFSVFVRSISHTLYYVNKRVEGVTPPLDAEGMIWGMQKVNALMKIMILQELGFANDLIENLLDRNHTFMHLRNV